MEKLGFTFSEEDYAEAEGSYGSSYIQRQEMLPERKRDAVEKLFYELSPSESLIYDSKYDLFREEDLAIEERDRKRDRQRRGA